MVAVGAEVAVVARALLRAVHLDLRRVEVDVDAARKRAATEQRVEGRAQDRLDEGASVGPAFQGVGQEAVHRRFRRERAADAILSPGGEDAAQHRVEAEVVGVRDVGEAEHAAVQGQAQHRVGAVGRPTGRPGILEVAEELPQDPGALLELPQVGHAAEARQAAVPGLDTERRPERGARCGRFTHEAGSRCAVVRSWLTIHRAKGAPHFISGSDPRGKPGLRNRAEAIRIHGTKCLVCGFDFNAFHGADFARDYIEVHHVLGLAGREMKPDPATHLACLCANCHKMAHRKERPSRRWRLSYPVAAAKIPHRLDAVRLKRDRRRPCPLARTSGAARSPRPWTVCSNAPRPCHRRVRAGGTLSATPR